MGFTVTEPEATGFTVTEPDEFVDNPEPAGFTVTEPEPTGFSVTEPEDAGEDIRTHEKIIPAFKAFGHETVGSVAQLPGLARGVSEAQSSGVERFAQMLGADEGTARLLKDAAQLSTIGGQLERSDREAVQEFNKNLDDFAVSEIKESENIRNRFSEEKESIVDLVKQRRGRDVGNKIGEMAIFEAPRLALQAALAYISSGASLGYMGTSAASRKYGALADENLTPSERVGNAIGTGVVEFFSEKLGTGRVLDKAFSGNMKKGALSKVKELMIDAIGGAVSEGTAQVGENMLDQMVGMDADLGNGIAEAMILGALFDSGVSIGGIANTARNDNRIRSGLRANGATDEEINSIMASAKMAITPELRNEVDKKIQEVFNRNRGDNSGEIGQANDIGRAQEILSQDTLSDKDIDELNDISEKIPAPDAFDIQQKIKEKQDVGDEKRRRGDLTDNEYERYRELIVKKSDTLTDDENQELDRLIDKRKSIQRMEAQDATERTETDGTEQAEATGREQERVRETTAATDQKTADQAENLQKEIAAFAKRISAGEKMSSAEDIQFYRNNAKAIESELQRMKGLGGDIVGASNESMNEIRRGLGEEELGEADTKKQTQTLQDAQDSGNKDNAESLAQRVLDSAGTKRPMLVDDVDIAAMTLKIADIKVEVGQKLAQRNAAQDAGDVELESKLNEDIGALIERMDVLTRGSQFGKTNVARALAAANIKINQFTYELVDLLNMARTAKGKPLTAEEQSSLEQTAAKIKQLEEQIADLEQQIRTGKFKESKRRKRKDEPREVTDLKVTLHQLQREARDKIYAMRNKKAVDWLKEWATLPRSLMATADMSYGLRQGLLPLFAHPKIATQTWGKAFKAFFSQNTADQIDLDIRDHPLYNEIVRLGTHFSSLDSAIDKRTEFFASHLAEKIPGFGAVVRASERNMVTGINLLRHGLMVDFLTKNPDASERSKQAYAKYVNVATGRGEAKLLDRAAEELSLAFFAPRFAVSRIQAPFLAAQNMQHPELRGEMVKQWAAYLGTGLTVLSLAKLAGAEVGDDPEDSDFGKIVIDNKRIDIWGGVQQPMRILAKAIKGGRQLHTTGETDVDTINDIGRFLRYKLSPPMLMINEMVSGKDAIGRETERLEIGGVEIPVADMLIRNMTPLIIQSAVEAHNEGETPLVVSGLAAGEGLGLSIGVYDK